MKCKKYIYFFNSNAALQTAKEDSSRDNLHYYDGEAIHPTPKNCINVPIEEFTNYFLHSDSPYPNEVNFHGLDISADIQTQITNNLITTIDNIKSQALEKLNILLLEDINSQNISLIVNTIMTHIKVNNFSAEEIPTPLVKKMLEVSTFLLENKISLGIEVDLTPYMSTDNMLILHLHYALSICSTPVDNYSSYTAQYFKALASFEDIEAMSTNFSLVYLLFPNDKINFYMEGLEKALIHKDFWTQNITQQKHAIFKLHYMIMINYSLSKESSRKNFYLLLNIFLEALNHENEELLFYLYTPLLSSWGSAADTQEEFKFFNTTIEKPLEKYIQDILIPKYNLKENSKQIQDKKVLKVAILQDRILDNHSVNDVLYSLLRAIKEYPNDRYEFTIYNLNFMDNGGSHLEQIQKIEDLGFKYVDLHKEYSNDYYYLFYPIVKKSLQIRQRTINDEIDILIGLNTRPEYNFLFTSRTVPRQIYWSHGNFEYDINGIDSYMSHFIASNKKSKNYKIFHLLQTIENSTQQSDLEEAREIIKSYPDNTVFIGTTGRLSKLANIPYLKTIKKILDESPNVLYIAAGSGDKKSITQMLSSLNINSDRFIFPGYVKLEIYSNIIDIFTDTFPFYQGNSRADYMHYTQDGVALRAYINQENRYEYHKQILDGLIKDEMLLSVLNKKLISVNNFYEILLTPLVRTSDEYIQTTLKCIKDIEYRQKLSYYSKILTTFQNEINKITATKEFTNILEEVTR